ncbi:homoserine o-acetyltransferase [Phaffia rhodozyma]|uniref:Homoserine o-acetyltransferase n=1 Tax=Phaffia rhodozyma TaxID=264483 RepID=A0A0F7SSM7_PHARH|nr:homoserine o-acetyltransferase [Phaffia rhodozyma]
MTTPVQTTYKIIPPTSRFASLIATQTIVQIPSFTLESGLEIRDVPVAYKTWGRLNERKDNCMVICHALTGSADVDDWWGPLMGPGKAFDPSRYFIFCANVMGSPYGSFSPVTTNPDTGKPWGPECPLTTARDDVRIHKVVLDSLGVNSVAAVIGGSMGGMTTLEWPMNTPPGFVRNILPLATSARHSAWCISWGEAQRQSIYSDPAYMDGYYADDAQPAFGLAAARMTALLTYRSRDSFETRFGRKTQGGLASGSIEVGARPESPVSPGAGDDAFNIHNDGHKGKKARGTDSPLTGATPGPTPTVFSAQSYLRYQGEKFTNRFDANCYIHLTRKMDTHDLARPHLSSPTSTSAPPPLSLPTTTPESTLAGVLSRLPANALVIGVATDGLFTIQEQRDLAGHIPQAELVVIPSPDGHDGFLLEFEVINEAASGWLKKRLPEIYEGEPLMKGEETEGFKAQKESLFGEAEGEDVSRW